MPTTAPSALWGVYALIDANFKTEKKGGIVGDVNHSSGYHVSPADLRRRGIDDTDYSYRCPADRRGQADQASAIDITFGSVNELITMHKRLKAACEVDDPRIWCVRETIGTVDGRNVSGWNRVATGSGSRSKIGWHATGYSDSTHLWHEHISLLRDTVNDRNAMAGLAEVICGLPVGALGWKADGTNETAPKPAYLPALVVDPAKVTTSLIANAPAGSDDLDRKPWFRIHTGVKADGKWLTTEAGYSYAVAYLALESEVLARPLADLYWTTEPVTAVAMVDGRTDLARPAGFEVSTAAKVVVWKDQLWLETEAQYRYPLTSMTSAGPAASKPAPPKPAAPAETPKAPTFTKVAYVNFPDVGNWQGVIPASGYYYGVEARKQKDGSEDCYVYRFPRGAEGTTATSELKPMHLNAGKGSKVHPTGWGVSDSGVLWLTWNGEGLGNDIVTVNYRTGATVTKAQTQQMRTFTDGNAQIAFDVDNEMASVRVITAGYDTHVLRAKQDILDEVDRPLGKVRIPRKPNRIVQGFTLVQHEGVWELRVLVGLKSAKSPYGIERWNAATGDHIATIPLPDRLGREPEGIDGDLVGFKTENRSGIDLYRYTL